MHYQLNYGCLSKDRHWILWIPDESFYIDRREHGLFELTMIDYGNLLAFFSAFLHHYLLGSLRVASFTVRIFASWELKYAAAHVYLSSGRLISRGLNLPKMCPWPAMLMTRDAPVLANKSMRRPVSRNGPGRERRIVCL